jgi:MOSC domain-containing protein YiiM
MRVVSVNVSGGRPLVYGGRPRKTGIFKEPVAGAVMARRLGLDGDVQVDKRYHGGPDKAVYSFAAEDLASWKDDLGELAPGAFGENLTTEGLDEAQVRPGDVLRFGGAVLQAVSPRQPCRTLAARYKDSKLPKRFVAKGRFGIYWRVVEEGPVSAGDPISFVSRREV